MDVDRCLRIWREVLAYVGQPPPSQGEILKALWEALKKEH